MKIVEKAFFFQYVFFLHVLRPWICLYRVDLSVYLKLVVRGEVPSSIKQPPSEGAQEATLSRHSSCHPQKALKQPPSAGTRAATLRRHSSTHPQQALEQPSSEGTRAATLRRHSSSHPQKALKQPPSKGTKLLHLYLATL